MRAGGSLNFDFRNTFANHSKHGKEVAQACTIGLSINENLKLEKGKEKRAAPLKVMYNPLVT